MELKQLKEKAKYLSVLYVEDEDDVRDKTSLLLNKLFSDVDVVCDGVEGLNKYLEKDYDIVITDILMPKMNGLELITQIREKNLKQEIIVMSAYSDSDYFIKCIQLGVTGYILKPVEISHILLTLEQSIYKLIAFREVQLYQTNLEQLVEEKTEKQFRLEAEKMANYEQTLTSLIKLIEERDTYTAGHSERVAEYCVKIAAKMGYDQEAQLKLSKASILHDIGKISTPDSILLNPKKLTDVEYGLIQEHVNVGYEVLSNIFMYKELAEIIYCHHERYDGKGYPRGLKNDEIPKLARVMIVADAFDAMTTNRIYKSRMTLDEATEELKKESCLQFDPDVVNATLKMLSEDDIEPVFVNQAPLSKLDDEKFAYFYKDNLTKLYNKTYLEYILNKNHEKKEYEFLTLICMRKFGQYNKKEGWSRGDSLLEHFALDLMKICSQKLVFRIFGDDFIIISQLELDVDLAKLSQAEYFRGSGIELELKSRKLEGITNLNMIDDMTH